ncbi:hypothetical protein CC1G_15190 [Coprinopsis cinerea okayama7|uniref:LIM zinc-binding domain-containing protein n=1 Tax=Coprinopsis cinerea (strain Okayama-7 / 130 / ATCC MYA-4618 / FGSC 9003) TaxID=240176 RepID=D6RPQ4_COPC7|nr:hypothetical protein CC1G_15190 [Coprinopsis cinerea okayama7\|eukprot:XP_002910555.1 hypothetical protein CC1G_15190 [Coprinopsis cinerea okayama7\
MLQTASVTEDTNLKTSASSVETALFPLTLCDNLSQESLTKAWLVEGILDVEKIRDALDTVVKKWPLVGGRVEVTGRKLKRYQINIPLGPLPPDYQAYILTTSTSPLPLSHYIQLPLAPFTKYPPLDIFMPFKERVGMTGLDAYAATLAPFTHWHLTYFKGAEGEYTCLGVNYSHGVFDGQGFALVMHAVTAELNGREWDVPPFPSPGLNTNEFGVVMQREYEKALMENELVRNPYVNWRVVGIGGLVKYLFGNWWHNWKYGVGDYNIVIPKKVHVGLVEEARKALEDEGITDVRPTSGDVITSWLMQTTYADERRANRMIALQNVGSLRGEWDNQFALYPHNCVTTLRCTPISVHDLLSLPLHHLAHRVAKARFSGSRIADCVGVYHLLKQADKQNGYIAPVHADADESFIMSNVSVARISDLDFRGAGGGRTVCHYRFFPTPSFRVNNLWGNNGRLENGDLVINAIVDDGRARLLKEEDNMHTRPETPVVRIVAKPGEVSGKGKPIELKETGMAHNAYYQQQQQAAPPPTQQPPQQTQYQYYQQPQNIYQQLGKPQPQPHLQRLATYSAQQQQPSNYQQYPPPTPQYGQSQFQTQPPQSSGFVTAPPQAAYGHPHAYPVPSPQPPPLPVQHQLPAQTHPPPQPPASSFPSRPTSSFIPTSSFPLGTPGSLGSSPQQAAPPPPPQQTGVPLSGSRPPISPSALLAQQARIRELQQQQQQAQAQAIPRQPSAPPPAPSASFAAAQAVFSGGASNTNVQPPPTPQTPGRRPLPQPAGNAGTTTPLVPPSVGLSRSTSTGRPMSMPPQIQTSLSTGASPVGTQQQQPLSAATPSSTKSRPLPGTPGDSSKRTTVDLGKISGLPVTNSTFPSYAQSDSQRSRPPSPTKTQTGDSAPQLPPLSMSSSNSNMGSLSRTTSMATGNESTPKRRASPPRFSSTSSSPTKEESHQRWHSNNSNPQGYSSQQPSSDPQKQSSGSVMNQSHVASSASSTSSASSAPPKKFTPIWKRTIPDYPAPVFGYAAGMVADPFSKPVSNNTPKASNSSPNTNVTPTGKGKNIEATTPTGKIKIRGIVGGDGSSSKDKDGSPSMLAYLNPTPPKGSHGGTPPGYHGHGQSGLSNVYTQGQGQGHSRHQSHPGYQQQQQQGYRQRYEESTEDDDEEEEDDDDDEDDEEDSEVAYQYEGSEYSSEEPHQRPPPPKSKSKMTVKSVPLKGSSGSKAKAHAQAQIERERERGLEKAKAAARQQAVSHNYPEQQQQPRRKKVRSLRDLVQSEEDQEEDDEEEDDEEDEEEDDEEEEERYRRSKQRKPARRQYEEYYDDTPTKSRTSQHAKSGSSTSASTMKQGRMKLTKAKPMKLKGDGGEDDYDYSPSSRPSSKMAMHRSRGSESDGFVVVDNGSPMKKGGKGKGHARHRSELDDWEKLEWEQQQQRQRRARSQSRHRYAEQEEEEEEEEEASEEVYEEPRKVRRSRSVHRREAESHGYEEEEQESMGRKGRGRSVAAHERQRSQRYDEEEYAQYNQQQQQRRAQSQHRRAQSEYQHRQQEPSEEEDDVYYQRPSRGSPVKFSSGGSGSWSPTKQSYPAGSPTKTMRMAEMWEAESHRSGSGGGNFSSNNANNYPSSSFPSSPTKDKGGFGDMGFGPPPHPHYQPSQTPSSMRPTTNTMQPSNNNNSRDGHPGNFGASGSTSNLRHQRSQSFDPNRGPSRGMMSTGSEDVQQGRGRMQSGEMQGGGGGGLGQRRGFHTRVRDASMDSSSSRRTAGSGMSSSSSVLSRSEFPPPPTHPSSPRPYLRLGIKDRERRSLYGGSEWDGASMYAGSQGSNVGSESEGDGEGYFARQQDRHRREEEEVDLDLDKTPKRGLPKPPSIAPSTSTSPRKLVKKSRPVSVPPGSMSGPASPVKGQGYGHGAYSEAEFSSHDVQSAVGGGGSPKKGGVRALASRFNVFGGQQQQQQPVQQPQSRQGSPRKLPPTPAGGQHGPWPGPAPTPTSEFRNGHPGGGYASAPSPAPSSTSSASTSSVKPPLPPRPNPSPALSRFARNGASHPSGNPNVGEPQRRQLPQQPQQQHQQQQHHQSQQPPSQLQGQPTGGGMVRGEVARNRVPIKGGYDALDEPPPRSLRTPSPAPSSVGGYQQQHQQQYHQNQQGQQQQYGQHRRGQSMYAEPQQQQQQPQEQRRPQSQIYGNSKYAGSSGSFSPASTEFSVSQPQYQHQHQPQQEQRRPQSQAYDSRYAGSSGSFSPTSTELSSISLPAPVQDPTSRPQHTPLPEFRKRQDIQCPAPVGGREKMANLQKMEEEEKELRRQQEQQQQQGNENGNGGGGPPSIPQINFDFVDSGSQQQNQNQNSSSASTASPNVSGIQIDVDDGSSSNNNQQRSNVPTISFDSFDTGVPTINEPHQQQQQQNVPKVNVFEIPGVSISGPQFDDDPNAANNRPPPQANPSRAGRKPPGGLICAGCEGAIVGRIVAAMNLRWHPQCFRCSVCQTLLEHVSSYEHDGRPYCHLDYHENFAPKCYSCKTSIIEEQFISLDDPALGKRTYHMEHFFCAECGDPFMTPSMSRSANGGELALSGDGDFEGFTVYKGHPYCEPCHVRLRLPKCKKCKKSIRDHDRAVEALGGKWCWACFVCEGCKKPFEDPSFFQRDNHPYCEQCFTIILRNEI